METLDLSRQTGIIDSRRLACPLTIIGVGGIGSALLFILAKMGCTSITVYDPDIVEEQNPANQLYRPADIGRPKVEAARDIVREFAGTGPAIRKEEWNGQPLAGVVCVCVDSMEARKKVWAAARYNGQIELLLEGRMGGLVGFGYCVKPFDPDDIAFYEPTLYSDDEADQLPCTERAIGFNVFGLASVMAAMLVSHLNGSSTPKEMSLDFRNFAFHARRGRVE